jgi:exodeoxyribonuclease III
MRVVGWNVRQGGGAPRAPKLVAALISLAADVVVIGEYRPSSPLSTLLVGRGWKHQVGMPDPTPGGNGAVLVVSRHPLREVEPRYLAPHAKHGWVNVEVVDSGWVVAGALIPGTDGRNPERRKKKEQFWNFVVSEFAPASANRPTLLIGDLNTGLHGIDEKGATLVCAEDMAALRHSGWIDVWHALHPNGRPPPSWWSNRGNPFRLDHAFLSPCSPAAVGIDYPAEIDGVPTTRAGAPRAATECPPLSDHVPVVIDLE